MKLRLFALFGAALIAACSSTQSALVPTEHATRATQTLPVQGSGGTGGSATPTPAPSDCTQTNTCQNAGCNGQLGVDSCGTNNTCLGMDTGHSCLSPGQCDTVTNQCNQPGSSGCENPFGCALNFHPFSSGSGGSPTAYKAYPALSYYYFNVGHFWTQHLACHMPGVTQDQMINAIAANLNTQGAFLATRNNFFSYATFQFSFEIAVGVSVTIKYTAASGSFFAGDVLVNTAYIPGASNC